MKTEAQYNDDLYALIEGMDDDTFEQWFATFAPSDRGNFPLVCWARYRAIHGRNILETLERVKKNSAQDRKPW